MSAFLPLRPGGGNERSDLPEPRLQSVLTEEERQGRWAVRAAQWRALDLAQQTFGINVRVQLIGGRAHGPMRGILRLDVPFLDLEHHRVREARFLSMVSADPLLACVPFVYVLGPHAA